MTVKLPVLALIGRPNVGKSTLFNCLTKTRDAIVADYPGLTRDRLYGQGRVGDRPYLVIDTGGIEGKIIKQGMESLMTQQTQQAIAEADHLLLIVDARAGISSADQTLVQQLRRSGKPVSLVVNKVDGLDATQASNEFYALGLGTPYKIAASHNLGISNLMAEILASFPVEEITEEMAANSAEGVDNLKIALVGRPNVGKSTLINRMLGEERVVVYDQPGTTRDSIYIPYSHFGRHYTLIDTAGVRRRGQIKAVVEKFSVVKTLQAINACNVVVLVLDAREGITEQDLHLLGFSLEAGKAAVIAVNKWDGLTLEQRERVRSELDRRLVFADYIAIKFISALHGTGVGELYPLIEAAYQSSQLKISTAELTRVLEQAVADHQPPLVKGRRIKLRYAHPGGHNPPVIVIHGKQTRSLPESYRRYLASVYRKTFNLVGTPIRIEFRDSDNPYLSKD